MPVSRPLRLSVWALASLSVLAGARRCLHSASRHYRSWPGPHGPDRRTAFFSHPNHALPMGRGTESLPLRLARGEGERERCLRLTAVAAAVVALGAAIVAIVIAVTFMLAL